MFNSVCARYTVALSLCLLTSSSLVVMSQTKIPGQTYMHYQQVVANSDDNNPAAGSPQAAAAVGDFCGQTRSMPFPSKPSFGKLTNIPFVFDNVTAIQTNIIPAKLKRVNLKFKKGTEFTNSYANLEFNQDLASLVGKTFIVTPNTPYEPSVPIVTTSVNFGSADAPNLKTHSYSASNHYGMRLTFSAMRGNTLPGYIVLHLPDPEHSLVEGYFYAATSTVDAH